MRKAVVVRWPAARRVAVITWVYFSARNAPWEPRFLCRIRADGSGLERLTESLAATLDVSSASPGRDGRRVVLSPGGATLALYDVATGTVTGIGISGRSPRWSPVDDRIAFLSGDPQSTVLQVVQADGTALQTLATDAFADGLDWSPDGRWLIVRGPRSLVVVNASTGEQLPLAPFRAPFTDPSWRP